jgi:hypothetical protein
MLKNYSHEPAIFVFSDRKPCGYNCLSLIHTKLRLLVFALEFLDASGCVYQFLFAGKKGVAVGADLQTDFGLC